MASVIVSGARTPMGRLLGNLKDLPATKLGGVAIKAALERAGVAPEQVQYVIMGQVLQAGAGQIPARQAAVEAGIPMSVPALTINKVCLSGLDAIALADQLIRAGEFDVVVAGGMESMTNAPHLLLGQRGGYKYGDVVLKDHMALDGLTDAWDCCAMGESTERHGTTKGKRLVWVGAGAIVVVPIVVNLITRRFGRSWRPPFGRGARPPGGLPQQMHGPCQRSKTVR